MPYHDKIVKRSNRNILVPFPIRGKADFERKTQKYETLKAEQKNSGLIEGFLRKVMAIEQRILLKICN